MKKKLVILGLITMGLLTGCDSNSNSNDNIKNDDFTVVSETGISGYGVRVVRNKETGCEYIIATGSGTSITPFLGKDGKIICEKGE